MPVAKFTLTGFDNLADRLAKLGEKTAGRVIRGALRSGAKIVQSGVRDETPVGKTRLLRSAIRVRAMRRKQHRIGVMVTVGAAFFKGETFYGGFVNYGHSIGRRSSNADLGLRKGKRRTRAERWAADDRDMLRRKVPPNPFVMRGFEAKQDDEQ